MSNNSYSQVPGSNAKHLWEAILEILCTTNVEVVFNQIGHFVMVGVENIIKDMNFPKRIWVWGRFVWFSSSWLDIPYRVSQKTKGLCVLYSILNFTNVDNYSIISEDNFTVKKLVEPLANLRDKNLKIILKIFKGYLCNFILLFN